MDRIIKRGLYLALILIIFSCEEKKPEAKRFVYSEMPAEKKEWFLAGLNTTSFEAGGNESHGYIENWVNEKTWATYRKNINPEKYLNKTIRISCSIKSNKVIKGSGFFVRADSVNKTVFMSYLNKKFIKGTTDYTFYEDTVTFSEKITNISYGVLLTGQGAVNFKNLKLEILH